MFPEIIIYSAVLTLIVYCITKIFSVTEYHKKRREAVFGWIHENLIQEIYLPLVKYSKEISEASYFEKENELQIDNLLFAISKFLDYISKNRKYVGGDEFFTQNRLSNKKLGDLSVKAIEEIAELYNDFGERDKPLVIQFLALCGNTKNYSDFIAVMDGNQIYDKNLFDEIQIKKEIIFEGRDYYKIIKSPIALLNDKDDIMQLYKRTKLCVLFALFSALLTYEISRVYKAWFVPHNDEVNLNKLLFRIEATLSFIDKFELQIKEYLETDIKYYEISEKIKIMEYQIEVSKSRLFDQSDEYNQNKIRIFIEDTSNDLAKRHDELNGIKINKNNSKDGLEGKLKKLCDNALYLLKYNKIRKDVKIYSIENSIRYEIGKHYATQFSFLFSLPIIAILAKHIINTNFQSNLSIQIISLGQIQAIVMFLILISILLESIGNIIFLKIKIGHKEIAKSIFNGLSIASLFLAIVILASIYFELQFSVQILEWVFKI